RAELGRRCRAAGGAVAAGAVTADALALARPVRGGLRAAPARHNDAVQPADAGALQRLDEAAPALGLRVSLAGDSPELLPRDGSPARRLLASALAAVVPAARDRTWQRLKVCREPRCRAAFYDASRNASGVWCSMSACGAAAKQRACVERRRARRAAGKAAAAS